MRTNIHAFTQSKHTGSYPGYISVNKEADGCYSISIRSDGGNDHAHLDLDREQLAKLAASIAAHLEEE